MCGEGGEYESAVFDCPLFRDKCIESVESETVHHVDNDIAPVAYLNFKQFKLVEKSEEVKEKHKDLIEELKANA